MTAARRFVVVITAAVATIATIAAMLACASSDPIPLPMPGFDAGGTPDAVADASRAAP